MADTQDKTRNRPLEGDVLDADHGIGQIPAIVNDGSLIAGLTRAEIDIQIETAHRHKRQLSEVVREIETYATMDTETAWACNFMKPQRVKDKETGQWVDGFIEGPSVFFARIVASCMGNCRAYSRRTDLTSTDVEATGIFHDLEKNYALATSVRESIMTSAKGNQTPKRYDDRQITLMTNVASAKAFRNAVLQAVPKAIWGAGYRAAIAANKGTKDTLVERREKMISAFADIDVDMRTLFEILAIGGKDDISLDVMYRAVGLLNAIKDGETTVAELLASRQPAEPATLSGAFDAAKGPNRAAPLKAKAQPAKTTESHDPQTGEIIEGETTGSAAQNAAKDSATSASATDASTGSAGASSGQKAPSEASGDGAKASEWMPTLPGHAKPGQTYHLESNVANADGDRAIYIDGEHKGTARSDKRWSVYAVHAPKAAPKQVAVQIREGFPLSDEVYHVADALDVDDKGKAQTFKNGEAFSRATLAAGNQVYAGHAPVEEKGAAGAEAEAGEDANAGETSSSKVSSDASPETDFAAFNAYASDIASKDSWLTIRATLGAFSKTDAYKNADPEMQTRARLVAFNAADALVQAKRDPVSHKTDPSYFTLWLLQAEKHEIKPAFAALVRSPAYQKLGDADKEKIALAVSEAVGG